MKRYQLIGRKKALSKRATPDYGKYHLHSLPYEILCQIFSNLSNDLPQLVRTSMICVKFNNIINKNFLYKLIKFTTIDKFMKFSEVHIPRRFGSIDTSTQVNYIQCMEIKNPPSKSSKNHETKIAGSYKLSDDNTQQVVFNDFIKNFKTVIQNDYNLKILVISEISPQFEFDSLSFFKRKSNRRSLGKLVLKAQTGWSILFKVNHLSAILEVFNDIHEVELCNFIIDETKLQKIGDIPSTSIDKIIFNSCSYINRPSKRTLCKIFQSTSSLSLIQLKNSNDLSLIDFIKFNENLSSLSIDMSSRIFYTVNEDGNNDPSFNYKSFNPFFKLICLSKSYNLKHLTLENFDLIHECNHQSLLARNNLLELLEIVSPLPTMVKIKQKSQTCTKCGFLKTEHLNKDWSSFLKSIHFRDFTISDSHRVIYHIKQ